METAESLKAVGEERPVEILGLHGVRDGTPFVLNSDGQYDPIVNGFLRMLPLLGKPARNTWIGYASDIVVWGRWLEEERSKGLWEADRSDVLSYEIARLGGDEAAPIAPSTWNRNVAALSGMYTWAVQEGRIDTNPFLRIGNRSRFRSEFGTRRGHDQGFEAQVPMTLRVPKKRLRYLNKEEFKAFRDVGLRGEPRSSNFKQSFPINANRNATFADIMFTVGYRLEELSSMMLMELPPEVDPTKKSTMLETPPAISKGRKIRKVWMPTQVWKWTRDYIEIERDEVAREAFSRGRYDGKGWIRATRESFDSLMIDGRRMKMGSLDANTRSKVLVEQLDGSYWPALLWLNADGMPTKREAWRSVFRRASSRCQLQGMAIQASPHTLRHSYATYALQNLGRRFSHSDPDASSSAGQIFRKLAFDPQRQVQLMLGHSSIETTMIYLETLPEVEEMISDSVADGVVARGDDRA